LLKQTYKSNVLENMVLIMQVKYSNKHIIYNYNNTTYSKELLITKVSTCMYNRIYKIYKNVWLIGYYTYIHVMPYPHILFP